MLIDFLLQTNEARISSDCTALYTCPAPLQPAVAPVTCNDNAVCALIDGVRDCYCEDGFERNDATDICEGKIYI